MKQKKVVQWLHENNNRLNHYFYIYNCPHKHISTHNEQNSNHQKKRHIIQIIKKREKGCGCIKKNIDKIKHQQLKENHHRGCGGFFSRSSPPTQISFLLFVCSFRLACRTWEGRKKNNSIRVKNIIFFFSCFLAL